MRCTTGSCSARLRALPLNFDEDRRAADAACGAPPGSTNILIGLLARPLAAALAMRRASLVNDISIIVLEAATFAISAFPFRLHSAFSNREMSICWLASVLRTASRRDSALAWALASILASVLILAFTSAPASAAAGSGSGAPANSSTAGAADPMMTRLALVALDPLVAPYDSALGAPLRAESAANGDTEFDRAEVGVSERRASAGE